MGKVRRILEQRAYGAMAAEEEAARSLEACRRSMPPADRRTRRSAEGKLRHARRRCEAAMALHDTFERAHRQAAEAMEVVDLGAGALRSPAQMQAEIEQAAGTMMTLGDERCRTVGRYVKNRAPGLVRYAAQLKATLDALSARHGATEVRLACVFQRLRSELQRGPGRGQRPAHRQHLLGVLAELKRRAGDRVSAVVGDVDAAFAARHRASSAIEGFNAALRPFLYVHKGVTQGFLELFRARYNLRTRRWGPHKGTSPHEVLTGKPVNDWLTELGYPPSTTAN
jgi:hypothetical protein